MADWCGPRSSKSHDQGAPEAHETPSNHARNAPSDVENVTVDSDGSLPKNAAGNGGRTIEDDSSALAPKVRRDGSLTAGVSLDITPKLAALLAQIASGDTKALAAAHETLNDLHRKAEGERREEQAAEGKRWRTAAAGDAPEGGGAPLVKLAAARTVAPRGRR